MAAKKIAWTTEKRKVNDLIPLEINPRKISEAKRMKMIESLQKFNLVDIPVIDKNNTVISGHQRLKALQAIGRGEELIDVRIPNRKLTQKEIKEYNILANTHFGEFDFDSIDANFDDIDFEEIGVELLGIDLSELTGGAEDFSDKNKEINIEDFGDEMILKLKFTEEQYTAVKKWFSNIEETPEKAILSLINNE